MTTLRLVPPLPDDDSPAEAASPPGTGNRLGGPARVLTVPPLVVEPLAARPVPAGHPAQMLTEIDDETCPYLEMDLHFAGSDPDLPTLTRWWAGFTAVRREDDGTVRQETTVAALGLTVVNPWAGNPVADLDALSQDSAELGEVLFDGAYRTPAFEVVTDAADGPVLLIDTYEVHPDWRGTDLTPLMVLRLLHTFTNLGVEAAALTAAPIAEDLSTEERTRAGAAIARMWAQAGFEALDLDEGDGLNNIVMGGFFDQPIVAQSLVELAGEDPVLRAAAELD